MTLGSILKRQKQEVRRWATCGDEIRGKGVEEDGKLFCHAWHAARYEPPASLWQRIRGGFDGGSGGSCC